MGIVNRATAPLNQTIYLHIQRDNGQRAGSVRNGLLCALAVAACILLSNPTANMAFMDDFSYAKTALDFARTGRFVYNGWAVETLGWQIPWGALFIKLFGFSFNVLRLSMLPIAMATVYLFHQILRRFGISPRNAVFGSLTMALSPLFLPVAASFMTDIPGLFVILLCLYMCQRAVAAASDRSALLWLCSAALVNVGGGTVRQIAWLGALVMVPSTAWLLRSRRGMKVAGVLLWIVSLLGVLACLHWFSLQPYSVPEHIFAGPIHAKMLVHLAAQLLKTILCLLLLVFPVSAAWLPWAAGRNARARLAGSIAMASLALLAFVLYRHGALDGWTIPWLTPVLAAQPILIPGALGIASSTVGVFTSVIFSLLVIAPAIAVLMQLSGHKTDIRKKIGMQSKAWDEIGWITIPFGISYIALLAPRGTYSYIQDRYVLGLVLVAIPLLLKLYQEKIGKNLPKASALILFAYAVYSVGGTHDFFAESRARVAVLQLVESSGVPRNLIQGRLASDGWFQIEGGGHINDPRIQNPAGAFVPYTMRWKIPGECLDWFTPYAPSITPEYFIVSDTAPCFAPTQYPPTHYTAWLPPFHRALYVQRLKDISN